MSILITILAIVVWFAGLALIFGKAYGLGIFTMLIGLLILRVAFAVSKYEDRRNETINRTINNIDKIAQNTKITNSGENQRVIQIVLDDKHSKVTVHYDSETNTTQIIRE